MSLFYFYEYGSESRTYNKNNSFEQEGKDIKQRCCQKKNHKYQPPSGNDQQRNKSDVKAEVEEEAGTPDESESWN